MDALFHLVIALAGGFLLAELLRMHYSKIVIVFLSLLSMLPDLEHLIDYAPINPRMGLHSMLIVLLPLFAYAILILSKRWKEKRNYLLILSVLLFGHLVMDTVSGINGIPLFYPLSSRSYLIPETWEIYLFNDNDKPLVSTYAIGLAAYFGAIGAVATISALFSKASLRKTGTRR